MSQRKSLLISLAITLVIALTAIGIRAAFFEPTESAAGPENVPSLVVPAYEDYDDDDSDDGDRENWFKDSFFDSNEGSDDDHEEDHEDEEDHDDDEH